MTARRPLTHRQDAIYYFILSFWLAQGYGPTLDDIVRECRLSSQSVANYNVAALERAGRICREPSIARSIRPTNYGDTWRDGRLTPINLRNTEVSP